MKPESTESPRSSDESLDELLREAEVTIRKSVEKLGLMSDQARDLLQNKPNSLLALAGASGLVAGALLRHSVSKRRAGEKLRVDPAYLLGGGLLAGVLIGPRLIDQLLSGLGLLGERARPHRETPETSSPDPVTLMNERPFERT